MADQEQQQQKKSVKLAMMLGVMVMVWYLLAMFVVLH
jgi:hypothetical protein